MSVEIILFWAFAIFTVASSLTVVLSRSPINSAMSLVSAFFFLAGIYVLLWAHTIAVFQVLVYAGAIMVLFLFVIMILSLGNETGAAIKWTAARAVGAASAVGILAVLVFALMKWPVGVTPNFNPAEFGTVAQLGGVLYTRYLFPFEAVSVLLLVAIVGSVVVAKSRI